MYTSYNRYPDEKGTESRMIDSALFDKTSTKVTTVTPMKRGLKDRMPSRFVCRYITQVTTVTPMKRGLKAVESCFDLPSASPSLQPLPR